MSNYKIIEVNSPKTKKEFLLFPVRLYQNEKKLDSPIRSGY